MSHDVCPLLNRLWPGPLPPEFLQSGQCGPAQARLSGWVRPEFSSFQPTVLMMKREFWLIYFRTPVSLLCPYLGKFSTCCWEVPAPSTCCVAEISYCPTSGEGGFPGSPVAWAWVVCVLLCVRCPWLKQSPAQLSGNNSGNKNPVWGLHMSHRNSVFSGSWHKPSLGLTHKSEKQCIFGIQDQDTMKSFNLIYHTCKQIFSDVSSHRTKLYIPTTCFNFPKSFIVICFENSLIISMCIIPFF